VGDRFIVSSSQQLARELVQGDSNAGADSSNTVAQMDLQMLRAILTDNRGQLIAQNMLEDGNTKEEAEAAIDALLELLGMVRDASLRFTAGSDELRLQATVRLSAASTGSE
jgi:hypothetical protein